MRQDERQNSIVREPTGQARQSLVIGVVNNMPQSAFQATSDQFDQLLRSAMPDGINLFLRIFSPADFGDGEVEVPHASYRREPIQNLWTATLDGLIVTGAEPQASHISAEPCLELLSRIINWAEAAEIPTVWSCLAAHAAVYLFDGIERQLRESKLFGVFACEQVRMHPLMAGSPDLWMIPHSRLNELSESRLVAKGYEILTRSDEVGPDTFVKKARASHLFLNGHPEYGQETLRYEFRRDVRRFLLGQRANYPASPTGYFPEDAAIRIAAFRDRATAQRSLDTLSHFPPDTATTMPWREAALSLFRNWLIEVANRKHAWMPHSDSDGQPQRDKCVLASRTSPSALSKAHATNGRAQSVRHGI